MPTLEAFLTLATKAAVAAKKEIGADVLSGDSSSALVVDAHVTASGEVVEAPTEKYIHKVRVTFAL